MTASKDAGEYCRNTTSTNSSSAGISEWIRKRSAGADTTSNLLAKYLQICLQPKDIFDCFDCPASFSHSTLSIRLTWGRAYVSPSKNCVLPSNWVRPNRFGTPSPVLVYSPIAYSQTRYAAAIGSVSTISCETAVSADAHAGVFGTTQLVAPRMISRLVKVKVTFCASSHGETASTYRLYIEILPLQTKIETYVNLVMLSSFFWPGFK